MIGVIETCRDSCFLGIADWRAAAPTPPAGAQASEVPTAPAAPSRAGAEVQQLREDVDALLTGEATATEQGKARLRALIAETQQQQGIERQQRRDERLLQRLSEGANLNARQRDELGQALTAERAQRQDILAKARAEAGGSFESVRPALQALRTKTDEKARQILDAEQYKQYTASRSFGRGSQRPGGPAEAAP